MQTEIAIPTESGSVLAFGDGDRDSPPVLILTPGLDDGSGYAKVAAALADHFHVARVKRRTYRSDIPAGTDIAEEAADVLLLAEALGRPLLVGHSSGGVVALEAMVAHPEAFAGAVLYEPPVVTELSLGGDATVRARRAVDEGRPGAAIEIFLRDVVEVSAIVARLASWYTSSSAKRRFLASRQIAELEALDRLGNRLDAYARITLPVLLVGGAKSPAHLAQRLDVLQSRLGHATRVLLERDGHDANVRHPRELADVIAGFAGEIMMNPSRG